MKKTVTVRSVNAPSYRREVDAAKYAAMKKTLLSALPRKAPGLTQKEMWDVCRKKASKALFPGTTLEWWVKCVQLDLEAQKTVVRDAGTPLRWRKK